MDGLLRKATKSVLLAELEKSVQVLPRLPESTATAYILDGMAIVQMTKAVHRVLESLLRNTTSISPPHFNSQEATGWMLYLIAHLTNLALSKEMNANVADLL